MHLCMCSSVYKSSIMSSMCTVPLKVLSGKENTEVRLINVQRRRLNLNTGSITLLHHCPAGTLLLSPPEPH